MYSKVCSTLWPPGLDSFNVPSFAECIFFFPCLAGCLPLDLATRPGGPFLPPGLLRSLPSGSSAWLPEAFSMGPASRSRALQPTATRSRFLPARSRPLHARCLLDVSFTQKVALTGTRRTCTQPQSFALALKRSRPGKSHAQPQIDRILALA